MCSNLIPRLFICSCYVVSLGMIVGPKTVSAVSLMNSLALLVLAAGEQEAAAHPASYGMVMVDFRFVKIEYGELLCRGVTLSVRDRVLGQPAFIQFLLPRLVGHLTQSAVLSLIFAHNCSPCF